MAIRRQEMPQWAKTIHKVNTYLTEDFLGGSKVIKLAWVINLHKFLTIFVVAGLMAGFDNTSNAAWVYLALHGTYGFCWLLKHIAFPDKSWETKSTVGGAVVVFLLLATYWVAPYLLISNGLGVDSTATPIWLLALCISLHTFGVVIMMVSDGQKFFTLKYRSGLIMEGMFKRVRHPNYAGEMMIYAAYALLVQHWLPWVILAYWWISIFYVNMLKAESSLSRYPEWEAYKARSGMVFPKLFGAGSDRQLQVE
jgi:protein-S-isoprenylcysteine O-methyltransferase Ste14